MHQLAHWGAPMMGPPRAEDLEDGWLVGALRMVFPPTSTARASSSGSATRSCHRERRVCEGPTDEPDAVVTGDAPGFYHLVVDRDVGAVSVRGDATRSRRSSRRFLRRSRSCLAAAPGDVESAAPDRLHARRKVDREDVVRGETEGEPSK